MLAAYTIETFGEDAAAAKFVCTATSCKGADATVQAQFSDLQKALNELAATLGHPTIVVDGALGKATADLAMWLAQKMSGDFLTAKGLNWLAASADPVAVWKGLAEQPVVYAAAFRGFIPEAAKMAAIASASKGASRKMAWGIGLVALAAVGAGSYTMYRRRRPF